MRRRCYSFTPTYYYTEKDSELQKTMAMHGYGKAGPYSEWLYVLILCSKRTVCSVTMMSFPESHVELPSCKFPGCSRPCYRESYGVVHDFCGRTHAQEYSKLYGYGVGTCIYTLTSGHREISFSSFLGPTTSSRRKNTTIFSSKQPVRGVHNIPALSARHTSNKIKFYNRGEPYYEFTNFYPCTVIIDGISWPTTEHYFQAQKFVGTPYLKKIRKLPNARDAFQLSRDPHVAIWQRPDWDSVKDDIMLKALRVKFSDCCNTQLRDKLRGTHEKILIEHTSNDSYWGDGGNGSGKNRLGELLMQVRNELKDTYGPYCTQNTQLYSSDDSSVPQKETPVSTMHKLRRSNSLSSITEYCHRTPAAPQARGSVASTPSWTPSVGGTRHSSWHSTSYSSTVKKATGQSFNKVKQGASKAASAGSKVFTPSSTTQSNRSSVNYDIITHTCKSTHV